MKDIKSSAKPSPELHIDERIVGEKSLILKALNLTTTQSQSVAHPLGIVSRIVRLCSCEGRTDITSRPISRCIKCGALSCKRCGEGPEHNTALIDVGNPRFLPSTFEMELTSVLSMSLLLLNLTVDCYRRVAR